MLFSRFVSSCMIPNSSSQCAETNSSVLKGTPDLGLSIVPSSDLSLTAYFHSDWGGCPDSRRSTSYYCVFLWSSLVSWSSKCQTTTSNFSAKAVAETIWLRQLLCDLGDPPHVQRWFIVTTFRPYIFPPIRCSISERSTLKLIFTLFVIRLLWVFFAFFMCLHIFNLLIYSPKAFLQLSFMTFCPVSTFVLLPFRLQGAVIVLVFN